MRSAHVTYKEILGKAKRMDAPVHLSTGNLARRLIANSPYPILKIGDAAQRIWHAGRWRRVYVSNPDHGITLLGSSAILKENLENEKLVSRKYTDDLEDKRLKAGWILISCSGTIGNCAFSNAQHAEKLASQDVIRIKPNNILRPGLIYAYLASRYGYAMLTQGTFGSVIQHIEPQHVESIPIPRFPESFQKEVDDLIQEAARLREETTDKLTDAERLLKKEAGLRALNPNDYDYYGPHSPGRGISCFVRSNRAVTTTSINAFNYSERIRLTKSLLGKTIPLKTILLNDNSFSTGSFPRVEVKEGFGVMLINQSDIFNTIIKGKNISSRKVNMSNIVAYGEVLIAGVGTLGENETFCRAIFANEDLAGQLVSGEFIRMKTKPSYPSGFLYLWLNSDYGFRLIRSTQAGTKQCRPIPKLFLDIPVPVISAECMYQIDKMVRNAHSKRHEANEKELKAISMVESAIERWSKH